MRLKHCVLPAFAILAAACHENNAQGPASGKPGAAPPVPVHVAKAVRKDVPFDVETFGNVEPVATVAIKAQVAGELIAVDFKEGQEVTKGKLLFTIQPKLYDTQLAQATANLERDRALADASQLFLKRQESLDAKGSGVKEELERARSLAASTAATVKADEAAELIAKTQQGYTTIESPIDGLAGSIRLRPGNLIRLADDLPLTTVVQMEPIYVTFALPEQHLELIRKGVNVEKEKSTLPVVARDTRDRRVLGDDGKVIFLANTVDSSTGTVTLKALFDNKDRGLWPGAFVDVSVRLKTDQNVIAVPSSAVMVGQHGSQVFVVKADGTAETRPVTVQRQAGEESIISKGLEAGEAVISGGQSRVVPGARVSVLEPESTPVRRDG